MNTINICNCLKLDSFGVDLPFSYSRPELIRFFYDNNIPINMPTEKQIIVESKLLFLDIIFNISFQFDGEKLIAVAISPNTYLEGKSLLCRYRKIQKALVNELGYPCNGLFRSILNILDPMSRSSYWRRNGIKIEHYLQDRFGVYEIINIKLVSA